MKKIIIVIFGITGDLAKRKLIPALYHLYAQNILTHCTIIGVAHQTASLDEILHQAIEYTEEVNKNTWHSFSKIFSYFTADVTSSDSMHQLAKYINDIEENMGIAHRLFYCAVAAHLFLPLTQLLSTHQICKKLDTEQSIWHRIVYEKPFGYDLKSAHAINDCIAHNFYESQIYRIDHYLTKEMVSNITLVRFANCIFEPLWNHQYIDQVHIVLHESIGIEGRGAYFDHYGTLSDVIQNHVLQMIALTAMESPQQLTSEKIRNERAKALSQIQFVDGILGQYDGYKNELHVQPNSLTDTFALLKMSINNDRWNGVPFFVYAGKKLHESKVAIYIKFKSTQYLKVKNNWPSSNWLTFQLSPEGTFLLQMNVKKVGKTDELMPVDMEFCHSCAFGSRNSMAYEILLQDILSGQTASTVRFDEIEHSWKIIDYIRKQQLSLYTYRGGTAGPDQMHACMKKWHMSQVPD